jgi:hypothetical protein
MVAMSNGLSDSPGVNAIIEHAAGLAQGQTWGAWVNALSLCGLDRIEIESTGRVHLGDDVFAALAESGVLHAASGSHIEIDALANIPLLSSSLKDLAALDVSTVHAVGMVDVKLGLTAADIPNLQDLFTPLGLDAHSTLPRHLFDNNGSGVGLVMDATTAQAMGMADGQIDASKVSSYVNQLSLLGITQVDVVHPSNAASTGVDVYQINAVGANPALGQLPTLTSVELLGPHPEVSHAFDLAMLNKNFVI